MKKSIRVFILLAAACYALLLAYVLFFWSTAIGYGRGYRMLNLTPLEAAEAYMTGGGLVRSQFMLNILLFVPLGFLLPLVFPRAAGAFWKTALIALCVTLGAETVQYFIGRSADIDDVIANLAGGVAGYALYMLCLALFGRFAFFRALSNSDRRAKPRFVIAAVIALLLIFGTPFALDGLNARGENWLFCSASPAVPACAKTDPEPAEAAGH